MLLADFMDASYALIMEERLRIDPLSDFLTTSEGIVDPRAKVERVPSKREVTQTNNEAMATLQAMMAQVKR